MPSTTPELLVEGRLFPTTDVSHAYNYSLRRLPNHRQFLNPLDYHQEIQGAVQSSLGHLFRYEASITFHTLPQTLNHIGIHITRHVSSIKKKKNHQLKLYAALHDSGAIKERLQTPYKSPGDPTPSNPHIAKSNAMFWPQTPCGIPKLLHINQIAHVVGHLGR